MANPKSKTAKKMFSIERNKIQEHLHLQKTITQKDHLDLYNHKLCLQLYRILQPKRSKEQVKKTQLHKPKIAPQML
jgi:hypothetical protein